MRKTYEFKANMNIETQRNCESWLALCCNLYNAAIEQRREAYRKQGVSFNRNTQSYELPEIKVDMPEFKQVGAQVLQQVLDRVHKAYKLFFSNLKAKNGRAGLPRFKSKSRYHSFTLKQYGWRLDGNRLYISGVGILKLRLSRPIEGDIKQVTVKRDSCGDWFVYFSCDNVPPKPTPESSNSTIGIDMGTDAFLTDSNGKKVDNPRHLRKSRKKLRKQQRKVSRCKRGSNRRKKAVKVVAKTHRKVRRHRRDCHFKVANQLIADNGVICVEKLNTAEMLEGDDAAKTGLRREIADAGWAQFLDILTFKAEEAGRLVIRVNPAFTSQDCSQCGLRVPKALSDREHYCPACDLRIDRDHNAALNVLQRGLGQSPQALTWSTSSCVA